MRLVFLAGIAAAILVACAGNDDGKDESGVVGSCIPNKTYPCLCGLDTGSQSCTAEGKLTVCDCRVADASPGKDPGPDSGGGGGGDAFCGDGKVDPGEACDDGNRISGDGCSASCAPDGRPDEALACPGQTVVVWAGTKTVLSGTTVGLDHHFSTSCTAAAGGDRMYEIQPSADGNLTVDATFAAGFDAVVEIRADVCDTGASALCESTFSAPFARVVPVLAHHRYLLVVDGFASGDEGAYAIELGLP